MTAPNSVTPKVAAQRRRILPRTRDSLAKGLNTDDAERLAHLNSMRAVIDDPATEKLHAWIHTNLTILDAKAQAILGLYSIALAALTVYYSTLASNTPAVIVGLIVVGFVVIAWSIIPLARVSYVYWSSTEEFLDPQMLLLDLLRVRDQRTIVIRQSVLKGAITLCIFATLLAWDIARRLGA